MNTSSQSIGLNSETNLKECWWMQAGAVDYKLCDRDYDCEHCPFDEIFHGAAKSDYSIETSTSDCRVRNTKQNSEAIHGFTAPAGLFYDRAHVWARIEEGGCVRIGLDDFATHILGRPYLVSIAPRGADIASGKRCSLITHQAGIAAIPSPLSGRVKEINPALGQHPALLSRDPFGAGWMLLIEPTDLREGLKQLLYGPRVAEWYQHEVARLVQKLNQLLSQDSVATGPTMNDGGWLHRDFMNALTADQLRQLIHSFFPLSPLGEAENNKAILDT